MPGNWSSALYFYLSKILPLLVLPVGIVLVFLFIALLSLIRRKRRPAITFMMMAMLVLWVASMPIVANSLLGRLEQQYPAVTPKDIPTSECIVVLGGAVSPVQPPRVDVELSETADRVYKAASLYRAGKGRQVIVSGGNLPWSPFEQTEAEAISILLADWGVPVSRIVLDGASRNTRENAINVRALLEQTGCVTPLLVTSAAHMKRAVATFAMVGIHVFPVAVDIHVVKTPKLTVFDFIPNVEALETTTAAMREWMAQVVYWLRGWN